MTLKFYQKVRSITEGFKPVVRLQRCDWKPGNRFAGDCGGNTSLLCYEEMTAYIFRVGRAPAPAYLQNMVRGKYAQRLKPQ